MTVWRPFFFQNFELFGYWLNLPDLSLPYSDKTFLVSAHTCSPQREQLLSQAEGRKTAWKITGLITETSEHKCSRHDHKVKAYLSELFHSLFLLLYFVQSCGLLVNECLQSTLTHLTYLSWSFACWIAATKSKRHVKWFLRCHWCWQMGFFHQMKINFKKIIYKVAWLETVFCLFWEHKACHPCTSKTLPVVLRMMVSALLFHSAEDRGSCLWTVWQCPFG